MPKQKSPLNYNAVLLPTADILNLFLDGIEQAVEGDLMGLVNAVGRAIAASAALLSARLGLKALVLTGALVTDFRQFSNALWRGLLGDCKRVRIAGGFSAGVIRSLRN